MNNVRIIKLSEVNPEEFKKLLFKFESEGIRYKMIFDDIKNDTLLMYNI